MPTFLTQYGFDLDQRPASFWIDGWRQHFPSDWIPLALVEAVHQGRYKAASVEQLLRLWLRRGQPKLGFNFEFSHKVWPDQQAEIVKAADEQTQLTPLQIFNHSYQPPPDWMQPAATITVGELQRQLQQQEVTPTLRKLLQILELD